MLRAAIALALLPAQCSPAPTRQAAPADQPAFTGYVVDQAQVLSAATRQRLTDSLGRFQRLTRHQLAVVTVSSLNGEAVEAYTLRLANRWGVGRKGADDGAVLLVAPHERKVRIEVGRGLERVLPNAFCQAILDREVTPRFVQGRYNEGVEAGVAAIIARLTPAQRNSAAAPPQAARAA